MVAVRKNDSKRNLGPGEKKEKDRKEKRLQKQKVRREKEIPWSDKAVKRTLHKKQETL